MGSTIYPRLLKLLGVHIRFVHFARIKGFSILFLLLRAVDTLLLDTMCMTVSWVNWTIFGGCKSTCEVWHPNGRRLCHRIEETSLLKRHALYT